MLEILGPEEAAEDAASGAVEKGSGAPLLGTGEPLREVDSMSSNRGVGMGCSHS